MNQSMIVDACRKLGIKPVAWREKSIGIQSQLTHGVFGLVFACYVILAWRSTTVDCNLNLYIFAYR